MDGWHALKGRGWAGHHALSGRATPSFKSPLTKHWAACEQNRRERLQRDPFLNIPQPPETRYPYLYSVKCPRYTPANFARFAPRRLKRWPQRKNPVGVANSSPPQRGNYRFKRRSAAGAAVELPPQPDDLKPTLGRQLNCRPKRGKLVNYLRLRHA